MRITIYIPPEQISILKKVQEDANKNRQGVGYILMKVYEKSELNEAENVKEK